MRRADAILSLYSARIEKVSSLKIKINTDGVRISSNKIYLRLADNEKILGQINVKNDQIESFLSA